MIGRRRHRAMARTPMVVGLGISYQREHLLARGLGLEHLKELLARLARPLVRQGASLAYGGHWRDEEDNFTYELLRLISAEQADVAVGADAPGDPGAPKAEAVIGKLYNHSPWPNYLSITPRIEAKWINCCRIVRITQGHAGFKASDWVSDADALAGSDLALLHEAITTGVMRRKMLEPISIQIPEVAEPEVIPGASARVVMGGKVDGYRGLLPGIFEEVLVSLEKKVPLYLLGGFGGAAEVLARTLLRTGSERPRELTEEWHRARTPKLPRLLELAGKTTLPAEVRLTGPSLDALFDLLEKARAGGLAAALNTGLSEDETSELLVTRDLVRVVRLVRKGLAERMQWVDLPA